MEKGDIAFTHIAFTRKDKLYVGAVAPTLEDRNVWHGFIIRKQPTGRDYWDVDTRIAGLAVVEARAGAERTVFVVGQDGRIELNLPAGSPWEDVDTSDEGPNRLRHLTCVRHIGDYLYVAGMRRQVYRRHLAYGPWQRADQGMLLPRDQVGAIGILSLDGTSPDNLHAVGFGGEIWHFDGKAWKQMPSPTNLKLEVVRYLNDESVMIAGGGGTILKGFADRWQVIDQNETKNTFWSMEPAFGAVYFATDTQLYRLQGDDFEQVDTGLGSIDVRSLAFADDYLVSVGPQDVVAFDGTQWELVMHEDITT